MKNTIIILGILMAFAFSSVSTLAAAKATKAAKAPKPVTGVVVDLAKALVTDAPKLSKSAADKLIADGQMIVLKVGTGKSAKYYIVVNKDGALATKMLAKYADAKAVNVYGKVSKGGGFNIIKADDIKPND
jgi:hypothetical protein